MLVMLFFYALLAMLQTCCTIVLHAFLPCRVHTVELNFTCIVLCVACLAVHM